MLPALRKILGHLWTANHTKKVPLFSGSAFFSNRVPKALTEKWVAHGGEISSGATLDVRARYFFAMDPSDPWVMKLFANSVVVIHAGWIVNCIEEAFVVPIAEYILDDMFIPKLPYKPTTNAYGVYVPLSERDNHIGTQSRPILVQTSDTPSTPMSMPRKRRREQAYFDSPSGSFVFSTFDKDGLPRRPRKLRKLRFDPFSPEGGKLGSETMQVPGLDWFEDQQDSQLGKGHGQHANIRLLSMSHMTMVRTPDTPDKPFASEEPTVPHRCEHLPDPTRVSPPVTPVYVQDKIQIAPNRTIDFTNLPSHTRRSFPEAAKTTKSRDTGTLLSITRLAENEVKTPKKISFADHARVFVYPVSPQRPDAKDSTTPGSAQQRLEANDETRTLGKKVKSYAEPTAVTKDLVAQPCSLEMNNEIPIQHLGDRFENDTLTLTMEDVESIRCRLLELATANGVDDDQLATMFELGKTFRGVAFRHVW